MPAYSRVMCDRLPLLPHLGRAVGARKTAQNGPPAPEIVGCGTPQIEPRGTYGESADATGHVLMAIDVVWAHVPTQSRIRVDAGGCITRNLVTWFKKWRKVCFIGLICGCCSPAHAEHGTSALRTHQEYTKPPTTQPKFIQNKREVPPQRPGRCCMSTAVWRFDEERGVV